MPGGSDAGMSLEISKIVLKLETNFKEVLRQQITSFDKFTRDANQLTRQVGTNMNQLAKTTSQTFSAMYKGNRREVQEFVSFSRTALQGVRKETVAMQSLQKRFEKDTVARYRKMRSELAQIKGKSDTVGQSKRLPEETKKNLMAMYKKQAEGVKAEYEKDIARMQKLTTSLLVRNLANAVNETMKTISRGSRAAAVTVNNVVKDMQSRFNQLYSQRKMMGQGDFTVAGTNFLTQRATQIKALESLMIQHQKKQIQAEQHLEKQKQLLSAQTNKTLIANQKLMVSEARSVVRKLGTEYEFMFNKIQSFSRGQTAITGVFKKQAEQGIAAIKQTLRGVNLKRDFDKMWANLEQTARLAGEKSGAAFYDAVRKGKALDTALIEKRKHLENLLVTAKKLHATGLIDAGSQIERLKKVIGGLKEFRGEFSKVKKEMSSIPQVSFGQFSKGGAQQARKLANEIRGSIAALKGMGKVTEDNVLQIQRALGEIQSLYKQHANKVINTQKTITLLNAQAVRARFNATNASNTASINAWQAYEAKVVAIITRLEGSLTRSTLPRKPFDEYQKESLAVMKKIRAEAARSMLPTTEIKNHARIMIGEYNRVGQKMDELGQKRLIKPEHLKEGVGYIEKLKNKVKEYNEQIVILGVQYDRLRVKQRAAVDTEGMSAQMSAMKKQMTELRQQVSQYEKLQMQMHSRMAKAKAQSLKRSTTSGWEMIRNFRWQVASVIYLITRAVWFVNRTIIKMLDQIGEYRKSAMSIAAAIAFQMIDTNEKAFDRAYAYSRKLMNQLEMVAAETILTLEDMLMLTKTLAQAGIIPKNEEDVRRIATIGTAIKALTEGMANAGVQMRQELYAVIQGRQRVTDQLAKMFQVMGINITKMIEDGKKEGKDMIEVLSDALAPFGEMNKRMVNEWEQVKNRVGVVLKLIQRIGGEDFLVAWSKELNALMDQFVTKGEDGFYRLTASGVSLSAWVNATFVTFKATFDIVIAIADVLGSLLMVIGNIAQGWVDIAAIMLGFEDSIKKNRSEWDGLITLLQVFVQGLNMVGVILNFVAALVRSIAIVFGVWIDRVKNWVGIMKSLKSFDLKGAKGFYDSFVEGGEKANEDIRKIWLGENGWIRKSWKGLDGVNQQFDELRKKASGIYDDVGNLGDIFKLPYNAAVLMEKAGKLASELKQLTLAGLEGPEKFAKEKEFSLADPKEFKNQLNENLAKLKYIVQGAIKGEFKVDPKKLTFYTNLLKGHEETLADLDKIVNAATQKELKQLKDWNKSRANEMAGWKKSYEDMWNSLAPKDDTRSKKTETWFENMTTNLEELRVKNPLVRAEFKKFQDQLKVAFGERQQQDIKEINEQIESMQLNLTSHRPVDAISKINDEFKKMELSIISNKDWVERGLVPSMLELLNVTKRERIEMEKLNMEFKASDAEIDVMSKKAEYLSESYSPAKQMQGQIQTIKINYKKELLTIQKEIDETYKIWVDNGQWATREGSAEAKRYVEALQDQMVELTKVTERELQKKQMPIWNDLTEASKGWADGFTDALSNIVDGIGSVQEAMNELQKTIIKDVVKTLIKRTITDNLQSALGSGFMGDETLFQKMFGGKKKEGGAQEITAKKPIPVMIVNPKGLLDPTVKAFEPMEKIPVPEMMPPQEVFAIKPLPVYITNMTNVPEGVFGTGQYPKDIPFSIEGLLPEDQLLKTSNPIPVFVTNMDEGGMGSMGDIVGMMGGMGGEGNMTETLGITNMKAIATDFAGITADILGNTEAASKSSKSWYSGILDSLSGIGSMISGLFSGGGKAGGAGGGTDWGSLLQMGMTAASMFGYADGGVINEPIVGKGMKSGSIYNFGEKTKYGEDEIVAPMNKLQGSHSEKYTVNMPIHLSAIDTQTGVQFLTKNMRVIENQMIRNMKNNRPVRKAIPNSY